MNQISVKVLTNWVTHIIAPESSIQHIGHGHHGHIASIVTVVIVLITIGITTGFLLDVTIMFFVGVRVITINIHLSLGRSVAPLTIRGTIPFLDLEAPREDPAAHNVVAFERVPLAQVLLEE